MGHATNTPPVVLRTMLRRMRSNSGIIWSKLDVNTWLKRPPTCSEARPASCSSCGAASRPEGGALVVHGHGVRTRQLRGPLVVGGPSVIIEIVVRRYQCQECDAVMTVVPCEVLRGMLFAAPAIALALALYGLSNQSAREVRGVVSPWLEVGTPAGGWKTLLRFIARAASLWSCIRPVLPTATTRMRAERAATTLAGYGKGESLVHAAFAGAVHAG